MQDNLNTQFKQNSKKTQKQNNKILIQLIYPISNTQKIHQSNKNLVKRINFHLVIISHSYSTTLNTKTIHSYTLLLYNKKNIHHKQNQKDIT